MENVLRHAPLCLVIALCVKAVILGISISDSLVAVSLVGLMTYREHMEKHKKINEIETSTLAKLEEMKKCINTQNHVIAEQAKEYDKLRNTMSGIKLQFGQKDISTGRKLG